MGPVPTIRRLVARAAAATVLAASVMVLSAAPVAAEGIEVTTTDDELNGAFNGTSLREAIAQASDAGNDTILLQHNATYQLDLCDADATNEEDANASGDLDLLSQSGIKTIEGQGATIEQTCPNEDVLELRFLATLRLEDVTITGGTRTDAGAVSGNGGIQLDGAEVTQNQRGIWSAGSGAQLSIVDSEVHDNGVGLATSLAGQVVVQDSAFHDNVALAISGFESPTQLLDSVFVDNGDGSAAGAISISGAQLTVEGSTFLGNEGGNGGAIRMSDAFVDVTDSTFLGNEASSGGGAIGVIDVHAAFPEGIVLDHVTAMANASSGGGGSIALFSMGSLEATASAIGGTTAVASCLVSGAMTSNGGNVDSGTSCGFDHPTDVEDVGDLELEPLSPGDEPGEQILVPAFGSPVVGTQPAAQCNLPRLDQRGVARGEDGDFDGEDDCDAGAVERPQDVFFTDVGTTHLFFTEIGWMAWHGISEGFQPGPTYEPSVAVSRQAMSAFMYRLAGEPPFSPPGSPTFSDVGVGHPFFAEIEWMADEGISTGYPDGTYGASLVVTRQAMSAFMFRLAGEPPFSPPGTPTFPDVGAGHPFFAEIEWIADEGISTGYPDGTYRPSIAVSRQAMAAFMSRLAPLIP